MAHIKKRTLQPLNWSAVKSFIDSMNCPLVTATVVGDTLELQMEEQGKFILYRDGTWFCFKYNFNGITHDVSTGCFPVNGELFPITLCCSDKLFYFDVTGRYHNPNENILLYDKISEDSIIIGSTRWRQDPHPIELLTCYELQSQAPVTYGKTLNYTTSINRIQYCENAPILNGDVKIINDPNFLSCTTVASNSIVTFNSDNYYSIGTNTLVLLDPEEQTNG